MKKIAGFTLVELLVVVVVVGIGFSLAVPSFQGMMKRNRIATQTNEMLLAISLARSEATLRGGVVSIQAQNAVAGDEWGEGYCVVEGDPGNCAGTVIRRFAALAGDTTLASIDDAGGGANWDASLDLIQFNDLGALEGTDNQLRSLDLCVAGQRGTRIQIALIGRAKSWRQVEAGATPPSVQPASCP